MDYVRTKIGRAVLYHNGAEGYATKSHDFTAWRRNPSISLLLYRALKCFDAVGWAAGRASGL